MRKISFIFILGLLVFQKADAQRDKDTVLYYMKSSGIMVTNKDEADYIMLSLPADSSSGTKLYSIVEYYPDGKRRLIGSTLARSSEPRFVGPCISFYPNGHRKRIEDFNDGTQPFNSTIYFPNGKLYTVTRYENKMLYYIDCRDSTGTILAENGNGKLILYNDDFTKIIATADVHKGLPDHMHFANTAYININGDNNQEIPPEYKGGYEAFNKFLRRNIRYPAIDQQNKTQGIVYVSFVIETDGSLTDIEAIRGPSQSLIDEAVRVIKLSPPWISGSQKGKSVRVQFTVPVNFSLERPN